MDESNWLAIAREIVQLMFVLFLISSLTKTHVINKKKLSKWWLSGKSLRPRDLLPLWS
jgi:hypothetical protein